VFIFFLEWLEGFLDLVFHWLFETLRGYWFLGTLVDILNFW
jgi:hypothetical protein